MALSQKHRATLFAQLSPVVGEEEAEALLAQFPARDLDVPATKEFVQAQVSDLRSDIRGQIAEFRAEFNDKFAEVHDRFAEVHDRFAEVHGEIAGMRGEIAGMHGEITGMRGEMHGEIAGLENRVLRRLNVMIIWMTGVLVTGIGVVASIVSLTS